MQDGGNTELEQESPIRPKGNDALKETRWGQAFVAVAPAPRTVTLDELEEAGAMAVDEAAEEQKAMANRK